MKNLPLILRNHLKSQYKPTNKLNWNYYLTGLIQGCGKVSLISNFDKLGYTIDISLEFNDIMLIHSLRDIIGYGKIQRYTHIALINYSIIEPKGLIKLYELTKNKFSLTNLNYSTFPSPLNNLNHLVMPHASVFPYSFKSWKPMDLSQMVSTDSKELTHKPWNDGTLYADIKPLLNYEIISHYWVSGVLDANIRKGHMQLNIKALYPLTENISDLGLEKEKHGSGKYLMSQIMFEIDLINSSYLTLTKVSQIFGLSLVNLNFFRIINFKIHPIDTHIRSYLHNSISEARKDGLSQGFKVLNYYKENKQSAMNRIFASHLKFSFPNVNLIKLLNHLDNYPLLTYKFPKFLKFRKIYRICQRKEHFHKSGLLKLLHLWECAREAL